MNPFGNYGELFRRSRAASSSQRDLGSATIGKLGALEAPVSIGTAMVGAVPAGFAGIASGGDPEAVRSVQERFTYQPRSRQGREALESAVGVLGNLAAPSEWVGSQAFDLTGSPAAATAAETFADPLNFLGPVVKAAAPAVTGLGSLAYLMNRGGRGAHAGPGASQRGMIGGRGAAQAPTEAMDRASARLAAGDDPNLVRMEEGNVFMGPDEKMRFEFSDENARFAGEALEDLDADTIRAMWRQTPEGQRLTNAARLHHIRSRVAPADVNREFKKYVGRLPTRQELEFADVLAPAALRSMRDQSINNFASVNPINFRLGDLLEHEELFKQYPAMRGTKVRWFDQPDARTRGEVDADDVVNLYMPAKGPKEEAMSTLLHELQHVIQSRENLSIGGGPSEFAFYGPERLDKFADAAERVAATTSDAALEADLIKKVKSARIWRDRLKEQGKAGQMAAWSAYRRLVGEVEARMVEARQSMTDAERLMVNPAESVPEASGTLFLKRADQGLTAPEPMPRGTRPLGSLY